MENACPALVSQSDYAKVQELMHQRSFVKVHPRRTSSSFLLSGLAKCGYCGKALIGQDTKGGKFSYYVCGTLNKKGAGSCPAPYLNSRKFEALITGKIRDHILTENNLTRLVRMVNEEMDSASSLCKDELDTILSELDSLRRRLGRLCDAIENGVEISYSDIAPRLHELRSRQGILEQRKAELQGLLSDRRIELANKDIVKRYVENLHDFLNESTLAKRKAFVRSFIKEVSIKDGEVRLVYTLPLTQDGLDEERLGVLPIVHYGGPFWTRTRDLSLIRTAL